MSFHFEKGKISVRRIWVVIRILLIPYNELDKICEAENGENVGNYSRWKICAGRYGN